MYYRDIGVSAECQLRFDVICFYWLLSCFLWRSHITKKKVVAYPTEIQVCLRYYIVMQTSIKQIQRVCQKFNSRFFVVKKHFQNSS